MSSWTTRAGVSFHLTSQKERLLAEHLDSAPAILGPVPALAHLSATRVLGLCSPLPKYNHLHWREWAESEANMPYMLSGLWDAWRLCLLISSAPLSVRINGEHHDWFDRVNGWSAGKAWSPWSHPSPQLQLEAKTPWPAAGYIWSKHLIGECSKFLKRSLDIHCHITEQSSNSIYLWFLFIISVPDTGR